MVSLAKNRKANGVLSRASNRGRMIGELVRCIWLDDSVCIILEKEVRKVGILLHYSIYLVHDFTTGERYWVDEEDLEKL